MSQQINEDYAKKHKILIESLLICFLVQSFKLSTKSEFLMTNINFENDSQNNNLTGKGAKSNNMLFLNPIRHVMSHPSS